MARSFLPNIDIGYPKLFIDGQASGALPSPQTAVNNFVGADAPLDFGWPLSCHWVIRHSWLSASAGQVCERRVASTTFAVTTGPPGGLDLLTTPQEAVVW
jgi:hypothetical protein